jgi:hypothetical protein
MTWREVLELKRHHASNLMSGIKSDCRKFVFFKQLLRLRVNAFSTFVSG